MLRRDSSHLSGAWLWRKMLPGTGFPALRSFYLTCGGSCEQGRRPPTPESEQVTKGDCADLKPLIDFQRLLEGAMKTWEKWNIGKIQTWEETWKCNEHKTQLQNINEPANIVFENVIKKSSITILSLLLYYQNIWDWGEHLITLASPRDSLFYRIYHRQESSMCFSLCISTRKKYLSKHPQ